MRKLNIMDRELDDLVELKNLATEMERTYAKMAFVIGGKDVIFGWIKVLKSEIKKLEKRFADLKKSNANRT